MVWDTSWDSFWDSFQDRFWDIVWENLVEKFSTIIVDDVLYLCFGQYIFWT